MTITIEAPTFLPNDFIWGFATAAAQIEGGGDEVEKASGRGMSIWDKFCDTPGKILDGSKVSRTCDFTSRWKDDLATMASLGVRSYRFSISWPRIIPLGGKDDPVNVKGIEFYNGVINECIRLGITPFVTLFHWDFPQELYERYGGFLDQEAFVADYVRYARVCYESFGDRVKYWLTFNEPWCIAVHGHGYGVFAPGHVSNKDPWIVGHSILVAHAHACHIYHTEFEPTQKGIIGITLNGDWTEPFDESPENVQAAQDKMDVAVGWFADPIFLGSYPISMKKMLGDRLPTFTEEELKLLKGSSDFYGCNTYTANTIKAGGDDEFNGNAQAGFDLPDGSEIGIKSSLDWLRDVPWGFRKLLKYLYDRYQSPIYITENGFAVKDESDMTKEVAVHDIGRVNFYTGYLESLRQAMVEDNVDIRSYFAWSFCDNFEWNSGLIPRFGCVRVDFDTLERTPKDSAKMLSKFFKEHISK